MHYGIFKNNKLRSYFQLRNSTKFNFLDVEKAMINVINFQRFKLIIFLKIIDVQVALLATYELFFNFLSTFTFEKVLGVMLKPVKRYMQKSNFKVCTF